MYAPLLRGNTDWIHSCRLYLIIMQFSLCQDKTDWICVCTYYAILFCVFLLELLAHAVEALSELVFKPSFHVQLLFALYFFPSWRPMHALRPFCKQGCDWPKQSTQSYVTEEKTFSTTLINFILSRRKQNLCCYMSLLRTIQRIVIGFIAVSYFRFHFC